MNIPFNDLSIKSTEQYLRLFKKFLKSGQFVNGQNVINFEKKFSKKFNFKYGVGCNSGTDAIEISLRLCKKSNQEAAITVSHTANGTVSGILRAGITPIFCDIEKKFNTMCPESLERTIKASLKKKIKVRYIIPVHIYGQLSDMERINNIASKYKLIVIEDCSQSHGAKYIKSKISKKNLSIFSLYPTKNLGAFGDAGIICTNNKLHFKKLRNLREYGWNKRICINKNGINSRLDEFQAVILLHKLKKLDFDLKKRQKLAKMYLNNIKNKKIELPKIRENTIHAFHLFVIKISNRQKFMNFLKTKKIGCALHYQQPLHKQKGLKNILKFEKLKNTEKLYKKIVSLPLNNSLSINNCIKVSKIINFYN